MRDLAQSRNEQQGSILALFSVSLVALFLIASLAIDLGVSYVASSGLTKAVDAGALAGAFNTGKGSAAMREIIDSVARANLAFNSSPLDASFSVAIDSPSTDTVRVRVSGQTQAPTLFSRIIGTTEVSVAQTAEATRYPLDLSLVLDISGSLVSARVFDDMQEASKRFVNAFDDRIDRVGMVSYMTIARELMPVQKHFKSTGTAIINRLRGGGWTNMDDGLRLAKQQMDDAPARSTSLKIVVLFTDGRPTAFTDSLWMDEGANDCRSMRNVGDGDGDGIPHCYVGAVSLNRRLYEIDNGHRVIGWSRNGSIRLAPPYSRSPVPIRLPDGQRVSNANITDISIAQTEEWANVIRNAGYTIYAVALGNPYASAAAQPDLALLRRLANEKGRVSRSQPEGEMLFAPSAAELEDVFAKLASRLLTRLTQ